MDRVRTLTARLALVLASCLLCFSALEIAARVLARIKRNERIAQSDPVLGWRLLPNVKRLTTNEQQPYWVETNSRGFRDSEHSLAKPPDVFRVLALGDSFVFGSGGVAPSERLTERLQSISPNLEVINAGVPGYSTDQEYLLLKSDGPAYRPDMVLVCMYANDFKESFVVYNGSVGRPKGYFSRRGSELQFHPPVLSRAEILTRHSYLFRSLQLLFRKIAGKRVPHPPFTDAEMDATYRLILSAMAGASRRQGAELVAVYIPCADQEDPLCKNIWQESRFREIVRVWAAENAAPFLDLTDFLAEAGAHQPAYFEHDIHLNAHGHELVARALYDFLLAHTSARSALRPVARPATPPANSRPPSTLHIPRSGARTRAGGVRFRAPGRTPG